MKFLLCATVILISLHAAVTETFELPAAPEFPDGVELPSNLVLPKPPVPPTTGPTDATSSSPGPSSEPGTETSSPSTDSKSEDFTYNFGPGLKIVFEGLSKYGITFKVRDPPGQKSKGDTNSPSTSTSSAPPETDPAATTSSAAPDATTPTA